MNENNEPQTLMEAIKHFADPDVSHDFVVSLRWPDGPTCPYCKSQNIGHIKSRRMFQCKDCRKQFSVKVGTIFEDSPLGLDKWLCAMWMVANCKNGVSSCEIGRGLGITQKAAWHMLHRIRLAMSTGSFEKMDGLVEVDETFVGGKAKNMHKDKKREKIEGRGAVGKVAVLGILKRGGEMRTEVVPNVRRIQLDPRVRANVEEGAEIHTDALASYESLQDGFTHKTVDHDKYYVLGNVHTNGAENYWSLLKRTLKGTYISVEPFHLFRYLNEQEYRFNNRKVTDFQRFKKLLGMISGKHLTYATLITEKSV